MVEVEGQAAFHSSVTEAGDWDGPSSKVVDVSYPGPGQLITTRNIKAFHAKNSTIRNLMGWSRNEYPDEGSFSLVEEARAVPGF